MRCVCCRVLAGERCRSPSPLNFFDPSQLICLFLSCASRVPVHFCRMYQRFCVCLACASACVSCTPDCAWPFLLNVSAILLVFEMCRVRLAYDWRVLRVGGECLAILSGGISVFACFLNVSRVYLICYTCTSSFLTKNHEKLKVFAYF